MIVFPDAVALLCELLRGSLPGALAGLDITEPVHIDSSVPNPRPPRLVRLEDTGGTLRDVAHESALIAVQVWAPTDVQAVDISRAVCALLRACAHPQLTSVSCSRPYLFPDPDSPDYRYQMTAEVICRPERTLP